LALTIDTFAWVEVIRGSPIGLRARQAMESADHCFTPAIVMAEIASKCFRDGLPDSRSLQHLRAIREASEIVTIQDPIAVSAAHAVEELRKFARSAGLPPPGLADGLILATARSKNSQLLTGDPHFRDSVETVWLS
jgi:predicted nucleic acid-binding protein